MHHHKTPSVTVLDSRGLTVRSIAYHRHPAVPDVTRERITRHQYDARGFLTHSADPRLQAAGLANFTYLTDLTGSVLRTVSADAGTTVALSDAAGRPFIAVSNIRTADDGTEDRSQAVTRTWQYEDAGLPGRPLSVTEQVSGDAARITERFVYAGHSEAEKALNLAGQCICHYDTAGLTQTGSVALTGVPLSVTRRLLKDADNPDTVADWQGEEAAAWHGLLTAENEGYTTLTTADATGAVLATTDPKGNIQRVAYDVAGLLSGSWLTLSGGKEQVIVRAQTWSAAGQKLREEYGNGVVTTYEYEPQTQRLTGIRTERPAGHRSGAKILQDLYYTYDPVGNVLKITNDAEETCFWRNQKVVPDNTYVYDSLYQLVSATGRERADAGQQGSQLPSVAVPLPADSAAYTNYTRTYTCDEAGNLTQIRHSAPATGNNYTTKITVSDRSNRGVLSTLTENAAEVDALFTAGGQQTQLQPGQALSWTARNELLTVTPVARDGAADDRESYRYGAGSQRILKVSVQQTKTRRQTQRVLYLPGLELRTTEAGSTQTQSLQVITAGEAGRAQVRVLHRESGRPDGIGNDQIRYSYDNLTGSSQLELDGDGNIISQEEYYPYGGTAVWTARNRVEAAYKTIRYSGKERDATGLYYYGYRYYQPWAGRWLSADPAGTVDGLNLFRMCRNNPVTLKDSNGLAPNDEERSFIESSYEEMGTRGKFWQYEGVPLIRGTTSFQENTSTLVNAYREWLPESQRKEQNDFRQAFYRLDIHLIHFTNADLDSNGTASFYSRQALHIARAEGKVKADLNSTRGNTTDFDIENLATDNFVFFSVGLSENGKGTSRFGRNRYSLPLEKLKDNLNIQNAHLALNDTLDFQRRVPEVGLDTQKKQEQRLINFFGKHDANKLLEEDLAPLTGQAIETLIHYDDIREGLANRMLHTAFNSGISDAGREKILSTRTAEKFDNLLSLLFRPQFLVPWKLTTTHFTKQG